MKSIEELQAELKQLYADLEERRIMELESVPQTVNFDELSSKAERCKIENHPMSSKDEREQEMYLLLLLSVISLDDNAYEKSFSLLYRISHGMGFNGNVQELFLKAQQMNFNTIDEITRMFINDDVRLVLLMECIMISQCFQKEKKKAVEYISELCILMKLEKEQIILISNIARVVLMQDINEYKCDIKNTYEVFDCYIAIINNIEVEVITYKSHYKLDKTDKTYKYTLDNTYNADLALMLLSSKKLVFSKCDTESLEYKSCASNGNLIRRSDVAIFNLKNNHTCVYHRNNVESSDEYKMIDTIFAVTTNAPYLAYHLTMRKYKEAGGIIE